MTYEFDESFSEEKPPSEAVAEPEAASEDRAEASEDPAEANAEPAEVNEGSADESPPLKGRKTRRKAAAEAPPGPWWKAVLRWVGEFVLYLLVAVIVVTLVRLFLVQPFLVPSGSMEKTLVEGDTILAWKPGEVSRGDIVVFRDDLGWLTPLDEDVSAWRRLLSWVKVLPPQDEQYLVKRLIGLPGDHVVCCDADHQIIVNGRPLDELDYVSFQDNEQTRLRFDVYVPEGKIFVMGDHRDRSADSRAHMCGGTKPTPDLSFPSLDAVQGKTVAIIRPLARATFFDPPPTFAAIPPPTPPETPVDQQSWACPLTP